MRFVATCLVVLVHSCGYLQWANATVTCRDDERLSLLSFKRGLGDVDSGGCVSDWGTAENQTDCCTWSGVSCDSRTGHVVELGLYGCVYNSSQGTISPSLAGLQHLTKLDLSHNNFTPTQFPTFILSLKRLQDLDLSHTNLKGRIPLQLGYSLSHLQTLSLAGNQLEGVLPKSLALCNLTYLYLPGNSLSGQLDDFFASFGRCANISLQFLYLSGNRFTGSVPDFSRFSFLEDIYLSGNQLNGTLTDNIGLLSKLKNLDISDNFLRGIISETHFLRHSQLITLDLSLNGFTFKIGPDWIPPFQLDGIGLASCKLGPDLPLWLRTQKSCSSLDISNNQISGTIPNWFWDLPLKDTMNLSHNQIVGEMQNFQFQNHLAIMDLSSNLFEGSIPSSLSHKVLLYLDLSNNKLTNANSFLCPNKTVRLGVLDISNNQLSGVLPDCWKYFESLVFLSVENNRFFGKIPTSMGSLKYVQSLHLGYNRFSGKIPPSMNRCTELVAFDAAQNNLSGLIPSWIADGLKKLRVLILRSNRFFGSLSPNICNLSQVQILDLSMNNISGSLPKCFNHLSALASPTNFDATISYVADPHREMFTYLLKKDIASLVWKGKMSKYQTILGLVKSIDLSCNMLRGEIPSEVMDLVGLVALNISRNMLSGQIPSTIGQLKLLDSLDLSRNYLSGHIPSQLSQINRLGVMDLSYNNLSGEIPPGTQLQSFDASSYAGNSDLCGAPLPKCSTRPTQDENSEEDEQLLSRGFFISLSLGFGIGFGGICSFIFLNKSFRYAYYRLVNDIYDKVYVAVAIKMAKLRRWRTSVSA